MKKVLTVCALALACAGCADVAPLVAAAGKMNSLAGVQDFATKAQSFNDKAQHVIEGQRELSQAEEVALGSGIASNMLGAAPLWQDKKAQRYVNQVGQWLASHTERADLQWHFAVLDDAELNAFAAPGGYIFITRALLQGMHNEAELAGVLAHEIAHVLRKHHLQALKKNAEKAIWADVGKYAMTQSSSLNRHAQLTPALTKLASAGTELYVRGLDKEDEFEADRMGVVIAARAGYDPYGLPAVLQSLQTVNPNHEGLVRMFKTHPSFSARLDQLALVMNRGFEKFESQPALTARFKTYVVSAKSK